MTQTQCNTRDNDRAPGYLSWLIPRLLARHANSRQPADTTSAVLIHQRGEIRLIMAEQSRMHRSFFHMIACFVYLKHAACWMLWKITVTVATVCWSLRSIKNIWCVIGAIQMWPLFMVFIDLILLSLFDQKVCVCVCTAVLWGHSVPNDQPAELMSLEIDFLKEKNGRHLPFFFSCESGRMQGLDYRFIFI